MPPAPQIKVFIVDDSAVSRVALRRDLESEPSIKVVGDARNGAEAITELEEVKPDLVTMDIHMPGKDGFETTREIMETRPLPVVIVSSSFKADDSAKTFRAMEAGAVAAVEKPPGPKHPEYRTKVGRLIRTVKAMSEVRVVRRLARAGSDTGDVGTVASLRGGHPDLKVVVIGASTGGPPVLRTILSGLPKPFPLPVVIVQHISTGFSEGLAKWLSSTTEMPVRIAAHRELVEPGSAYIAPDSLQASIENDGRISCVDAAPEHGLRPSVSYLFRSAAKNFGAKAVGVLLTGMGRDGAEELKLMRDRGAVTMAQDRESSIVHGMPGEAIRLDAATHVGDPERIASLLGTIGDSRTSMLSKDE